MKELIRQALARGYCTKRNGHKILDPDLIEDMAKEIEKIEALKALEEAKAELPEESKFSITRLSLAWARGYNAFRSQAVQVVAKLKLRIKELEDEKKV